MIAGLIICSLGGLMILLAFILDIRNWEENKGLLVVGLLIALLGGMLIGVYSDSKRKIRNVKSFYIENVITYQDTIPVDTTYTIHFIK